MLNPARSPDGENRWRRRARRGWVLLACAAGVVVGLIWVDQGLKRAPYAGFRPGEATLTVTAVNLPGFLSALEYSHAGTALSTAWPEPVDTLSREVRLATGIRPTPQRCRVWLGESALASVGPDGAGLCVRPGVAAHLAHWVNLLWHGREANGCYRYGDFYYDWYNGFLLIARHPGYVRAAREAAPLNWPANLAHDELHMAWNGEPAGEVVLGGATGLRLSGAIAWDGTPRRKALSLGMAWPEPPLAMAAASDPDVLMKLSRLAWEKLAPLVEPFEPGWATFLFEKAGQTMAAWNLEPLPNDWAARADECALALYPDDATLGDNPLAAAFVMRAPFSASLPHPFAPWLTPGESRHYQWGAVEGAAQPLLGPATMLCLATDGADWLATSTPALMQRLAGNLAMTQGVAADVVIEADWAGIARIIMQLARDATEYQLIPGLNTRDVDEVLGPPLSVLGDLGRLQIAGRVRAGQMRLRGHLALPREQQP